MLAQTRRISLILALATAAVAGWTPVANAAAIQVALSSAYDSSATHLEVHGTATCGQPGGQATVSVTAVQVMDFVFGSGSTTITCAAGPVNWHLTVYGSPSWHTGSVTVNALFSDGAGLATDSRNFGL